MAEIDSLEVRLTSDAQSAVNSLKALQSQLAAVSQQISQVNKNALKINFSISGDGEKQVDRLQKSVDSVAKTMSKRLTDAFTLDKSTIKQVQQFSREFAQAVKNSGGKSSEEALSAVDKIKNAIVETQSTTKKATAEMKEFYNEINAVSKIKVGKIDMPAEDWKSLDGLLRGKLNYSEGTPLDSLFGKEGEGGWLDRYGNLLNGFDLTNVNDQVNALNHILDETRNGIEQISASDQKLMEADVIGKVAKSANEAIKNIKNVKTALDTTGGTTDTSSTGFTELSNGLKKIGSIDAENLVSVGNALRSVAQGIKSLDGISANVTPLQQIAEISKSLSPSNMTGLSSVGNSLSTFITAMNGTEGITFNTDQLRELVTSISTLGYKSATTATENLKTVKTDLQEFIRGMNEIGAVTFNAESLTGIISSIRNLGSQSATAAAQNLQTIPAALQSFVSQMNSLGAFTFDTGGLTGLVESISKLGGAKATAAAKNLPTLSAQIQNLIRQLNNIGKLNFDVKPVTELATALSVLGRKTATEAATNIPKLTAALKQMMATLSTAPTVSANVIQMTNALAALGSTGAKSGTAANSLTGSLIRTPTITKKASNGFKGLASTIGKLYATYWIFFRAFSKIGDAIDISSDLTEVQNVVDQTFGQYKYKMEEFADTADTMYGMSELTAKTLGGRFQAMGSAMGIATDQMSDMSIALTGLAGDMASFYNEDISEIGTALNSVFSGETEPLRRFGLDLTQATLKEWALKNGLDANISSMNQAEKTMLRYQYVMANTVDAQGDWNRTSGTWANQCRLMSLQLQQLASIIGGVFINAFKPALKALNSFMSSVVSFAQTIADALGHIFGWTIETTNVGITDDLGTAADYADDTASGLGDAAKNAKSLNKQLRSVDELNNLTTNDGTSSSGSGSGGSGSGTTGSGTSSTKLKKTDSVVDKISSSIDTLGELGNTIRDTLIEAMQGIDWNSIYEKASNFGSGLASFLNGLIERDVNGDSVFGELGKTLAGALNTILYAVFSFSEEFEWADFGSTLKDGINNFLDKYDFGTTGWTIGNLVSGLATSVYTMISDKSTWNKLGKKIAQGINGFAKSMNKVDKKTGLNGWQTLAEDLNSLVDGVKEAIATALSNLTWGDILKGIGDFLGTLELDTVSVAIGALAFKHGGKELTKALLKSKLASKLGLSKGKLALKAIGLALTFSSIDFMLDNSSGEKTWKDQLSSFIGTALGLTALGVPFQYSLVVSIFVTTLFGDPEVLNENEPSTKGMTPKQSTSNNSSSSKSSTKSNDDSWKEKNNEKVYGSKGGGAGHSLEETPTTLGKIKKNFDEFAKGISDKAGEIHTNVSTAWDGVKTKTKNTWDNVGTKISGVTSTAKGNVKTAWENVKSNTTTAWDGVKSKTSTVWENVKEKVGTSVSNAKTNVNTAWENIKSKTSTTWENAKSKTSTTWDNIKSKISTCVSNAKTNASTAWENIKSKTSTTWDTVSSKTSTVWDGVKTKMSNVFSTTKKKASNWYSTISSYFDEDDWNFSGIKDGLEKAFNSAISGVKGIWNSFATWLNKKLNFSWDDVKIAGKTIVKGGSLNLGKIPTFAAGGFPDVGSLFIAGERGAEMLGTVGGKTAVASGEEITGIRDAVYSTSQQEVVLLKQQNQLLQGILQKEFGISTNDIGKAARSYAKTYMARTGNPAYAF